MSAYSIVFSLAPKASRNSWPNSSSTAVSVSEIAICSEKLPPSSFSAVSRSPRPIAMEARGALPEATSAANAVTIIMIGMHTPTPVSARLPMPAMWPM